jgi:methyl-accepting chemotaxis protein
MSVNEKMTALADEIRELSGTTTTKSIDTMISDVDAANTEVSSQMNLINQIATALEGKARCTIIKEE